MNRYAGIEEDTQHPFLASVHMHIVQDVDTDRQTDTLPHTQQLLLFCNILGTGF